MVKYRKSNPYPTKHHGGLIKPELLVVHTTEGGSKAWLDGAFSGRNPLYKLSVHWCIYKDGEIIEYAPWEPGKAVKCYHAGVSLWNGRESCNGWSLGYEIQHASGEEYTEAQILAILYLNTLVKRAYPEIELVYHSQIAYPRGRKSDPTSPWKTQVEPRVNAAWKEEDMAVSIVDPNNVKPELDRLVKAGLVTKPEARALDDAASVGLLWVIAGRLAKILEDAGLLPKA